MCKLDVTFEADNSHNISTVTISLSPVEAASLATVLLENVNQMRERDYIYMTSDKKCIIIQTVKETE